MACVRSIQPQRHNDTKWMPAGLNAVKHRQTLNPPRAVTIRLQSASLCLRVFVVQIRDSLEDRVQEALAALVEEGAIGDLEATAVDIDQQDVGVREPDAILLQIANDEVADAAVRLRFPVGDAELALQRDQPLHLAGQIATLQLRLSHTPRFGVELAQVRQHRDLLALAVQESDMMPRP